MADAPRYWWQEEDGSREESTEPMPAEARPPARSPVDDLLLRRAGLIREALTHKRGTAKRRAIEARLVTITAELLRLEIGRRR
jgi:hypothetical protein